MTPSPTRYHPLASTGLCMSLLAAATMLSWHAATNTPCRQSVYQTEYSSASERRDVYAWSHFDWRCNRCHEQYPNRDHDRALFTQISGYGREAEY
jgi:hypothetical protein